MVDYLHGMRCSRKPRDVVDLIIVRVDRTRRVDELAVRDAVERKAAVRQSREAQRHGENAR